MFRSFLHEFCSCVLRMASHRSLSLALLVGSMLLVSGCDRASLMKHVASSQDEATAKRYVDLLRQKNFELIRADFNPAFVTDDTDQKLTEMANVFPATQLISEKTIGYSKSEVSGNSTRSTTLEYQFPDRWVFAEVTMQQLDGDTKILSFKVQPSWESIENLNRFTLSGKNLEQYTVLLLAIASASCCIYAFILCTRTKIAKHKWLWLLFTLFGVGQFDVNWTTAQSHLLLDSLHLITGGATAPIYGSWTVYASLPLGAVIFLYNRRSLEKH